MTTPRHTPGPWVIDDAFKTSTVITNDTGIVICQIHGCGPGATADGRLITAAPDLLEALRMWMEIHDKPAFKGKYGKALGAAIHAQQVKVDAAAAAARAAIAKATGGAGIDAMEKYGHAGKISVKRLEEV